jgi:hypothetical protein
MEGNVHEVVRLLIARMESHPEEFQGDKITGPIDAPAGDRWWRAKELVREYGTDEEKAVVRTAMRKIMLNAAHEWMMDELLNGDERRREWREKEEMSLQKQTLLAQQQLLQQIPSQYINPSPYINQLGAAAMSTQLTSLQSPTDRLKGLLKGRK